MTAKELVYEQYLKYSNIPVKYTDNKQLYPSNDDKQVFIELKKIEDNIKEFVDSGSNLLLCSHYAGNGKTSWATRLLKSYLLHHACNYYYKTNPVMFVNVPEYLDMKKRAIKDEELQVEVDRIENCIYNSKLVVFDDISSKTISDYDMNSLYCWINYRTSREMSCIYTSNAEVEDLKKNLSESIYSRVINYSSVKVLKGKDRRQSW